MAKSLTEMQSDCERFWNQLFRICDKVAAHTLGRIEAERDFLEQVLPYWRRGLEEGIKSRYGSEIVFGKEGIELRPPPHCEYDEEVLDFLLKIALWKTYHTAAWVADLVVRANLAPPEGGTHLTLAVIAALGALRALPAQITHFLELPDEHLRAFGTAGLSAWAARTINLRKNKTLRGLLDQAQGAQGRLEKLRTELPPAVFSSLKPIAGNAAALRLTLDELSHVLTKFLKGDNAKANRDGALLISLVTANLKNHLEHDQGLNLPKHPDLSRRAVQYPLPSADSERSIGNQLDEFIAKDGAECQFTAIDDEDEIYMRCESAGLSPHEKQVILDQARGVKTEETASRLGITVGTVRVHRRNAISKLKSAS